MKSYTKNQLHKKYNLNYYYNKNFTKLLTVQLELNMKFLELNELLIFISNWIIYYSRIFVFSNIDKKKLPIINNISYYVLNIKNLKTNLNFYKFNYIKLRIYKFLFLNTCLYISFYFKNINCLKILDRIYLDKNY